jgi:hypothetical protein
MYLIEAIISGIWATLFMDFFAKILSKRKLIHPFITQEELGRWFVYLFKGKITHKDIVKTPPVPNEKIWYYVSHYLIGIFLSGFYLILASQFKLPGESTWMALVFGILTVILPWFWLFPGIGLGVMANKSSKRNLILKTNLINHTNFGLGLFLWFILFHSLFLNN